MHSKIFIILAILLFALAHAKDESEFGRDDVWEYLKGVENEADYDSYVKDLDSRAPENLDLFREEYVQKAGARPKFIGRRNRAVYPERDFEGNCPPGYRTDRLGMCREIW